MSGMGQQRRRPRRLKSVQGNRRIYDIRQWHKRSSSESGNKNLATWGQPPAGWMLMWAGRFKRWRRRWFVAHPPGLLLHYKNGDQIGRPGCISLLGATASPTPGKERQLKIVRSSNVYYLRTINKDFRQERMQAWLDAIHESIRIYNKSVQKAAVGAMPGRSLLPQQSVPQNMREEWEAQERELNRRLAERMQDLEPSSQEFLQQLQSLQLSLSAISGALGFSEKPGTVPAGGGEGGPDNSVTPVERSEVNYTRRSSAFPGREGHRRMPSHEIGGSDFAQSVLATSMSLPESSFLPTQRSIFKWKSDVEERQGKKRSSKSAPSTWLSSEKLVARSKRRSFSFSLDESIRGEDYAFLQEGSCIGGECFKWRRKSSSSRFLEIQRHLDKQVESKTHSNGLKSSLVGESKENGEREESHASQSKELGGKAGGQGEGNLPSQERTLRSEEPGPGPDRLETSVEIHEERSNERRTSNFAVATPSSIEGAEKSVPVIKGPLHAAWHLMQEAFAEALKGEIHRTLELEAENAVLQESLASLPQLKKDRIDLLRLRESLQSRDEGKTKKVGDLDENAGYGEVVHDSEDEITIVHSDLADEEYFEALEVLNQHDFVAKSSKSDDLEVFTNRDDESHEPPEEGDIPADAELSEVEGDDVEQTRSRLPAPKPLSRGFSLWTVLKNAIGKDLNHITMPATINEPLSVLQKCAEEMQYRYILERAAEEESSIMRLLHVSTFACASYHGSIYRDAKPFNPLLGETYEWLATDEKSWFLTEQVSHHPPIMAFHSECVIGNFEIYGEIEIKNKFWGKSVEVLPTGVCHLRYKKHGDHFTWSKVTTCAHNVVVGKLWIDNYGEMVIKNHTTGDVSRIRFHKAGSKEQCRISGKVYDGKGSLKFSIHGNYQERIFAIREPSNHEEVEEIHLWNCPPQIDDFRQQYCFSKFSISLNELTPSLGEILPPTDSRFRPDQRALEDGDLEKATPEKLRLEEKQRQARKIRNEKGGKWECAWFKQRVPGVSQVKTGDDGEEPSWLYQGEYWQARETQTWQRCADIM